MLCDVPGCLGYVQLFTVISALCVCVCVSGCDGQAGELLKQTQRHADSPTCSQSRVTVCTVNAQPALSASDQLLQR